MRWTNLGTEQVSLFPLVLKGIKAEPFFVACWCWISQLSFGMFTHQHAYLHPLLLNFENDYNQPHQLIYANCRGTA